jgi:hypothetical protein
MLSRHLDCFLYHNYWYVGKDFRGYDSFEMFPMPRFIEAVKNACRRGLSQLSGKRGVLEITDNHDGSVSIEYNGKPLSGEPSQTPVETMIRSVEGLLEAA